MFLTANQTHDKDYILLALSLTFGKEKVILLKISCKEFWFGIKKAAELLMLMRLFCCLGLGCCILSACKRKEVKSNGERSSQMVQ
jgi:hypothetical protein